MAQAGEVVGTSETSYQDRGVFSACIKRQEAESLQPGRPLLPAVKYGDQLQALALYTVRNDVWGIRHDKFSRAKHAARATHLRDRSVLLRIVCGLLSQVGKVPEWPF